MLTALRLALSDAFLPEQRRAVLTSLCLALALLIALWLGATLLLSGVNLAGIPWLDTAIEILGSLGALLLAWLLFPAMTSFRPAARAMAMALWAPLIRSIRPKKTSGASRETRGTKVYLLVSTPS